MNNEHEVDHKVCYRRTTWISCTTQYTHCITDQDTHEDRAIQQFAAGGERVWFECLCMGLQDVHADIFFHNLASR